MGGKTFRFDGVIDLENQRGIGRHPLLLSKSAGKLDPVLKPVLIFSHSVQFTPLLRGVLRTASFPANLVNRDARVGR
jgi:hypothetical protein